MRFVIVALLAAPFGLLLMGSAVAAPPSDEEKQLALRTHNDFRRRVADDETRRLKGPVVIPNLIWDDKLAAFAQEWADSEAARLKTLSFEAGRPQHRQNNPNGENLYTGWSTPGTPDVSPVRAVQWWFSEQIYYDVNSNTCSAPPNETCGHYTQVVWAATQRLGCGRSEWQSKNAKSETVNNVLWVCNYAPPGNVTGQRPYNLPPSPAGGDVGGAGSAPAENARVAVVFNHMHVNDCPEIGKCDWKLICSVGDQPEIELLRMEEAGSKADIPINSVLTQPGTLPVTARCTVKERDGPFLLLDDPVWELVGTSSVTIRNSGKQELRVNQNTNEGDVTIHMTIEALGTVQTGSTVPPPPSSPAPAAPSGCGVRLAGDSVSCGNLSIACDAPLPTADDVLIAARGDLLRSMSVDFVDRGNGRIDGSYSGEGNLVLAVCTRNINGPRRCSNRFAVSFGSSFCPGPLPTPRPCPDGLRPCPSVPFRCISPTESCDLQR